MEQQQISPKKQKALEKVKRANAELAKVVREEKEQLRKAQDRHKYMMGGCVVKYFPEAYDFSEQEMNRIIACAFSLKDVKNMINTVLKERPDPAVFNDEEEDENNGFDTDETEENDRGGTARPAGGVLRTAVVCRGQPRGDTTFPLRCFRTYPYVYFALGKALKSRASPGTKSVMSVRPCFGMPSRWKVRCGNDS